MEDNVKLKIEKVEKLKEKAKREHRDVKFSAFVAGLDGILAIRSAIVTARLGADADLVSLIVFIVCTGLIGGLSVKNFADMLRSLHKENKLNDEIDKLNDEIGWRK